MWKRFVGAMKKKAPINQLMEIKEADSESETQ